MPRDAPSGVPDSFEEHMQLMFDLQVLALQSDLTRVITFKTGFDQSNRTFPRSGTTKSIHGASHHGNVPAEVIDFHKINRYRLGQLRLLPREDARYGRGRGVRCWTRQRSSGGLAMADPNLHNHRRAIRFCSWGHANGALEGGLPCTGPRGHADGERAPQPDAGDRARRDGDVRRQQRERFAHGLAAWGRPANRRSDVGMSAR